MDCAVLLSFQPNDSISDAKKTISTVIQQYDNVLVVESFASNKEENQGGNVSTYSIYQYCQENNINHLFIQASPNVIKTNFNFNIIKKSIQKILNQGEQRFPQTPSF